MTSRTLGFILLSPAFLFVVAFFLAPVVLTAVFAMTNMTTATGITGGDWQVRPATIRALTTRHGEPELAAALEARTFTVDEQGLNALEASGAEAALVREMRSDLLGQSFADRRTMERAIRDLDNRPRSTRAQKAVAEFFERSVGGNRYASEQDFLDAVTSLGFTLTPEQADILLQEAWTGWSWTTENFTRMISLPDNHLTLINTLFYVFVTLVLFNTGFALVLAISTHYMPEQPAAWFRSIWLLPRVLPSVLFVLLFKWLAWDTGFLSSFLDNFGIAPRNWMLHTSTNAWIFVITINGIVGASMGMLIFSSAIKAIPNQILYASEVDGASQWQQIRYVVLPHLRWPILFITTYQTLSLLTSFEYILLATDGGPGGSTEVWALMAYHTALSNYAGNLSYGYGAALALVLVLVGVVLSIAYLFFFDFKAQVRPPRIEA